MSNRAKMFLYPILGGLCIGGPMFLFIKIDPTGRAAILHLVTGIAAQIFQILAGAASKDTLIEDIRQDLADLRRKP